MEEKHLKSGLSKPTENNNPFVVYGPYIPLQGNGTYVNGVKVYDRRWWVNIFVKIKLLFMPKLRKSIKKVSEKKVDPRFYTNIITLKETYE